MGRWKRNGLIVVKFATDHDPPHVHVFEDGRRLLKFDIDSWVVLEGKLSSKAASVLDGLRREGVFDAEPGIQGN